jgi:hypothetical protein
MYFAKTITNTAEEEQAMRQKTLDKFDAVLDRAEAKIKEGRSPHFAGEAEALGLARASWYGLLKKIEEQDPARRKRYKALKTQGLALAEDPSPKIAKPRAVRASEEVEQGIELERYTGVDSGDPEGSRTIGLALRIAPDGSILILGVVESNLATVLQAALAATRGQNDTGRETEAG